MKPRARICVGACAVSILLFSSGTDVIAADRENLEISDHSGFVLLPTESDRVEGPTPWVWYAPTLGKRHPNRDEQWMFDRLHAKGIAIAGVDVGESYGSPQGRKVYQEFYEELTRNRGFSPKPVLLGRSRGGLMLYSWAVEHPHSVGGIAGIYPVCNLVSYPGVAKAAPAFDLTSEGLSAALAAHNPVERLRALAEARVPIFHIQGDSDRVVPHEQNSGLLAERYRKLGGPVEIELVEGQGHNMWRGWFESTTLTRFMIDRALGSTITDSATDCVDVTPGSFPRLSFPTNERFGSTPLVPVWQSKIVAHWASLASPNSELEDLATRHVE